MKILLIFVFIVACLNNYGQENPNAVLQDINAEPYLEEISRFFDPEKALQIEFKYDVETPDPPTKVSDYGSIIIKGDKYKLKTEDGEMYFNGNVLWVYNLSAKEVYKSIPASESMDDMLMAPFRLIKDYKKYYKYRLKDDVLQSGTVYVQLELYPIDLKTSYSIMRVLINKKTGKFFSFSMQQKNGILYTIFSREIIKDVKINESAFSWNHTLYPDVMEIEM